MKLKRLSPLVKPKRLSPPNLRLHPLLAVPSGGPARDVGIGEISMIQSIVVFLMFASIHLLNHGLTLALDAQGRTSGIAGITITHMKLAVADGSKPRLGRLRSESLERDVIRLLRNQLQVCQAPLMVKNWVQEMRREAGSVLPNSPGLVVDDESLIPKKQPRNLKRLMRQ